MGSRAFRRSWRDHQHNWHTADRRAPGKAGKAARDEHRTAWTPQASAVKVYKPDGSMTEVPAQPAGRFAASDREPAATPFDLPDAPGMVEGSLSPRAEAGCDEHDR